MNEEKNGYYDKLGGNDARIHSVITANNKTEKERMRKLIVILGKSSCLDLLVRLKETGYCLWFFSQIKMAAKKEAVDTKATAKN